MGGEDTSTSLLPWVSTRRSATYKKKERKKKREKEEGERKQKPTARRERGGNGLDDTIGFEGTRAVDTSQLRLASERRDSENIRESNFRKRPSSPLIFQSAGILRRDWDHVRRALSLAFLVLLASTISKYSRATRRHAYRIIYAACSENRNGVYFNSGG